MNKKGELKRATLLRNLKTIIERIPQLDLPVTIVAVYAFGGMLREKSRLHDFDVLFLYSMTPDQASRWDIFRHNFSSSGRCSQDYEHPIADLEDALLPLKKRGLSLHDAVQDEQVASRLEQKDIPPSWAGCFSWTQIFEGYFGNGIFYPELDMVIRRTLIGKEFRGLQVQIQNKDDFEKKTMSLHPKNYVLAWSTEKPDVAENIESRSQEDRTQYIIKELDYFINEQIPMLKTRSFGGRGYLDFKEAVAKASVEAGVKIDVGALDKKHILVERTGNESYDELRQKCETARNEMRKYQRETEVLNHLLSVLGYWTSRNEHAQIGQIAEWVIRRVPKVDVKENDVREVLQTLGLPEENVITIRGYGFTDYRVPENEEDRRRILEQVRIQKTRKDYLRRIQKTLKLLDKDAEANLKLTEDGKPKWLEITVQKEVEEDKEKEAVISQLKARNFTLDDWPWGIIARKQTLLTGRENLPQLQEIAKQMLVK